MRFITKTMHAYIDYPVAIGLMSFPFLLGLSELATALSVVTGLAALMLTALTDHQTGLAKILPYKVHLAVDGLVGVAFVAAPLVLSLSGLDATYFWVIGGTVLLVVASHRPEENTSAAI